MRNVIIVALAIMAGLVGMLAPAIVKHVGRTRRVRDIDAAKEIRLSVERLIIEEDPETSVGSYTYTGAAMDRDYFWVVEYDMDSGHVNRIYLTPNPSSSVKYELYPDCQDFLDGK